MIYLDNAATTFPKPEVVYNVMNEVNRGCCVNAGRGSYTLARKATEIIDDTRQRIAKLVKFQDASKVILAPSVTIAINQILNGIQWKQNDVIYVSPFEHNAVARTVHSLSKKYGVKVIELPLDINKLELDMEKLKYDFTVNHPTCVCMNHISNVTGYIQPVEQVFKEAKKYDAVTLLDAAQSFGLLDIDANSIKADFIAFAGHKTLYGPFGVGGYIYITNDIELGEFIVGGTGSDSLNLDMPKGVPYRYESSSPDVVAIAGLNAALKWKDDINNIQQHKMELTVYFLERISELEHVKLYVPKNRDKHIGVVSFNIKGYTAHDVGQILDQDFEISVRTGYHCAPYIHKWLKNDEYHGTVRVSFGYFNTKEDIDSLVKALKELILEI